MKTKRCPECIRPICQRVISISDICSDNSKKKELFRPFRWEEITGESLNEIKMPDGLDGTG